MKSSTSGSVRLNWMSLDPATLSALLLQTSIFTCDDIKNLYHDNVYLASFVRKFITDLIQLIGSPLTQRKSDVWPKTTVLT